MRDFVNRATGAVHVASASIATDTTTNGAGVDLKDKNGVLFVFSSGAYTDGTYTPNVQVSDDNSTWEDASAEELIGTETAIGAANTTVLMGVVTLKRYARVQIVSTDTTSGAFVGIDSVVFDS